MKHYPSRMTRRARALALGAGLLVLAVPILLGAGRSAPVASEDLAYVVVDNSTPAPGTTLMITDIPNASNRDEVPRQKCFDIPGALGCFFDHPTWSPDGERLAFSFTAVAESRGPFQIWIADRDGRNARNVTGTQGDSRHPAWSPTGRYIAFDEGGDIYRVDLCSNKTPLPVERIGRGTNPSWYPSNGYIAYEFQGDIYKMWWGGSSVTQLTHDEAVDKDPAWSKDPQGKDLQITWASNRGGSFDIFMMESDGSKVHVVVKDSGDQYAPDLLENFPGVVYEENRTIFFGGSGARRHIVDGFSPAMGLKGRKGRICPQK